MAERRALVEGVKAAKAVERTVEDQFVYADKQKDSTPEAPATAAEPDKAKEQAAVPVGRVGLTIRLRSDYATALKRASLQRRLNEVLPNTLQDILEEALEPWLRTHGYLN